MDALKGIGCLALLSMLVGERGLTFTPQHLHVPSTLILDKHCSLWPVYYLLQPHFPGPGLGMRLYITWILSS